MAWQALDRQRGHLLPWVPVCMALGIGLYFAAKSEPGQGQTLLWVAGLILSLLIVWWGGASFAPVCLAVAFICVGFLLAQLRAETVAAPKLDFRYYGPITGRIVAIDRSFSDKPRLTLDQVRLDGVAAYKQPTRIRISLHGGRDDFHPQAGAVIHTTGHLSPPDGPVEPGGFDFQRHAWFQGLGAVGYTRKQVIVLERPKSRQFWLRLYQYRMALSAHIRNTLPPESGAVAAAVLVGDRSEIERPVMQNLRASNLAHLLAISGLHMGLLTGFVFLSLRLILISLPRVAQDLPTRKLAAVGALGAGGAYLLISGMSVATERAFVMVSVMFLAILLNRRALSLRAVALAAVVILSLRPEALLGPGFQMSFAATTALVASFSALQRLDTRQLPAVLRPVMMTVFSSFIAGAATAPVAAAHFNQIAQLGLVANVLSVPVMGLVVMPAAVLAACLAPIGADWIGLNIMHLGLGWILSVADWVAGLDQALAFVVTPMQMVLPALALGSLWVVLWQGRFRWLGLMPIGAAFVLWMQTERPLILIAANGGLVGVMTDQGRVLSRAKGNGFAARSWLENDGDAALQWQAHRRAAQSEQKGVWLMQLGPVTLRHLTGKTGLAHVDTCRTGDITITSHPIEGLSECMVFDPVRLRKTGSLAIFASDQTDALNVLSARERSGDRLWNLPNRRKR